MNKTATRTLASGKEMPVLGLGTWKLTNKTGETVKAALELGYRMIDTSGDYGTQQGVGEGIRNSGVARDAIYLATKVEEDEDAYKSAQKNLKELGLEYADLILIHRPPKKGVGEELWEGLQRAKKEGLALDIGVSNYSVAQIQELVDKSGEMPAVNQIEWSPFGHSEDLLAFCQENNIILQAYSPLTHGKRLDDATLGDIARKYGKETAQVLVRWNLQLGTVPLPKANQLAHLKANIDVFDFKLSDDDMVRLGSLDEQYSSLGDKLAYV
ncbi:MAG: aldo/keto reductase [Candidatus Saccharimonadales bacterium]